MELLTPSVGLIFWQIVVFLLLFLVLMKFAWKPIISALREREDFVQRSLEEAKAAQEQTAQTKTKNEALVEETYRRRDELVAKAQQLTKEMKTKAQEDTQKIVDKMLSNAKKSISTEEQAARVRLQHLVAELAIQISEKVLREQLSETTQARSLIEKYVKELPTS